jgi:hypothetical protein
MRRILATTVAAGTLALAGAAPALADETVLFQAQVNQLNLISSSCEAGVCDIAFEGSGGANIIGPIAFSIVLVQDFTVLPCNPSGQITFIGATGSITLADRGTVCDNTANPSLLPNTISSGWEITGGTGDFSGITGSGTSEGTSGGNGPVVHFTGSVSSQEVER